MKSHASHANRPRRRRGVSMSGLRRIEKIVALGDRAFYRQFNSAVRRQMKGADYVASI
jgi:hypothetical protein